jgi:putative hydrolase of the HAD superfamily
MITTIIFDLGGVYFTDGTKITVGKISKKFNLNSEKVFNFLKTGNKLAGLYRKGEITSDEFWNKFKETFGIHAENQELTRMWVESYEPIQETIEIVVKLKEMGFGLYFLSDSVKERAEYLQQKYDFLKNFTGGIFSHKVHKTKLDETDVFKLVLKMTGEKPENVVYIDDKEEYVKLAEKLGMNAIWFKNPEQLKSGLRKLGINL